MLFWFSRISLPRMRLRPSSVGVKDDGSRGYTVAMSQSPNRDVACRNACEECTMQSMAVQIQVLNDLRPEEREDVRGARELEARDNFLRHSSASDHMALLQYAHALASLHTKSWQPHGDPESFAAYLGQIRSCHESVVASAYHNGVPVGQIHRSSDASGSMCRSSAQRTTWTPAPWPHAAS